MHNCLVCNGQKLKLLYEGILKCSDCRFITADVEISDDKIQSMYSKNYFNGDAYSDYIADKRIIQVNFKRRLNHMMKYINKTDNKMLFEIGCAYGFFLELANEKFHQVSGIDISGDAVEHAANALKMDVKAIDYLKYNITNPVDVICMWDTIEHLKHPEKYIEKASTHLNKGGYVFITTGNIGSLNAKMRGKRWRQITPPHHLHYFSKSTISKLLDKNGFDVVDISYFGSLMSLESIANIIFLIRSDRAKIYNCLKKTGILNINVYINFFDLMCVVAKKR